MKIKISMLILLFIGLFVVNYLVKEFYIKQEIINNQKAKISMLKKSEKNILLISDIIEKLAISDKVKNLLKLRDKNEAEYKINNLLTKKYKLLKKENVIGLKFFSMYNNLKPIYGFEMNRKEPIYFVILPVFGGQKILGGLKISFSFDVFRQLSGGRCFLLVNKKSLNKFILKDYLPYPLDKDYLINKKELKLVDSRLELVKGKKLYLKNGKYYILNHIKISDVSNQNFLKLVYFSESKTIKYVINEYYKYNYLIVISLLLILLIIYFYEKFQLQVEYSSVDELTKALNRRGCNQKIKNKIKTDVYASLIMFDIDFFKKINDSYGHDIGDEVLIELSKLVSNTIRLNDVFCRIGGEEFVIYLSNAKLRDAKKVAQNIRKKIANYEFKEVGNVTISLGVAEKLLADDWDSLLKRADSALYRAKKLGRNRVQSDKI